MAFDYNSRTKWEKERVDRWNKEHEKQVKNLSPAQQELFGEVRDFSSYPHCGFPVINKWSREKAKKDAGGTIVQPAPCLSLQFASKRQQMGC